MTERIFSCPVCEATDFSPFIETTDFFLTGEDFAIQQCAACEFKFINPRPDEAEIGRYYQSAEYISHDAKSKSLFSRLYKLARFVSIRSKFNIVQRHANQGTILDIGCGTGEFLRYCKSRGFEVSGVEPNEKAALYAQKVNKIPVTNILSNLAGKTGNFDCITLWHVLEHLHSLNESLDVVKELLAPGGVLIIAVPNGDSWDAQKYGKYWAAFDVPRHLYHFNEATLTKLMTKHGFELQKVIPQKLDAYYVSMLSEKYWSGRTNYLKSLFVGFWSNFQALKQGRGHSSQIFVLSAKKA